MERGDQKKRGIPSLDVATREFLASEIVRGVWGINTGSRLAQIQVGIQRESNWIQLGLAIVSKALPPMADWVRRRFSMSFDLAQHALDPAQIASSTYVDKFDGKPNKLRGMTCPSHHPLFIPPSKSNGDRSNHPKPIVRADALLLTHLTFLQRIKRFAWIIHESYVCVKRTRPNSSTK